MIITKLCGGLGNQMFQYCAARQLAEKHRTILKLDISGFEACSLRRYSLWAFNIVENISSRGEVMALRGCDTGRIGRRLGNIFENIFDLRPIRKSYFREKTFAFDPNVLCLPDNVYLDGYWQSEKYFLAVAGIIRSELTLKVRESTLDRAVSRDIERSLSVSVHVRRGDYITNEHTNRVHGACGLSYYARSAAVMQRSDWSPHFFVFSDDSVWTASKLTLPGSTTFVDHNGPDLDFQDLRLMSKCKHHIIANSSFSWWGAWLCTNENKVVIAPSQWFSAGDRGTKDLIPENWIRI